VKILAIIIDKERPEETQEAIYSVYRQADSLMIRGYDLDIDVWKNSAANNKGVAEPTNLIVNNNKSDFLLLMDNDAVLDDGFLDACFEIIEERPRCAVVCGRVKQTRDDSILTSKLLNSVKEMYQEGDDQFFDVYGLSDPNKPSKVGVYAGTGCLVRTDAFLQAGGYDPKYFAYYCEAQLAAKLIQKGWEIWYQPKAVVYHKLTHKSRDLGLMLYLMIRNHYFFQIEYIPWRYAVPNCLKWFLWALLKGWRDPVNILRAYLDVLRALPKLLSNRDVTYDPYILMGWKRWLR
jgi:GT2 family glycosyltransferase